MLDWRCGPELNVSESMKTVRGSRIASFYEPLPKWSIPIRILSFAGLLLWLVGLRYPNFHFGRLIGQLGWFLGAGLFAGRRRICIYEKGLGFPKAFGEVFLSQEQLLRIKLEGDSLVVAGPDSTWGGPYSGGTFRIRSQDLLRFNGLIARFQHP